MSNATKELLINCDSSRRNDLDGRGNLSEEALANFSRFFLETCLDQVSFMTNLIQPERLKNRILSWVEEQELPAKSGRLLAAIIYKGGEISRKEAAGIIDVGERQARRILLILIKKEVLTAIRIITQALLVTDGNQKQIKSQSRMTALLNNVITNQTVIDPTELFWNPAHFFRIDEMFLRYSCLLV